MRDAGLWVAVGIGVALALFLFLPIMGMGMMGGWCPWCPMMGRGMMGGWGPGFGWWGLAMMFFWVLLIVGVVLLVAWVVRQLPASPTGTGRSRAIEILQERYARGEITREQYEQMRRDLEAPTGS